MSTFANILASLLLPPFCFISMGCVGIIVWRWRPRLGRLLTGVSLALLWIVSTSAFNMPFLESMSWSAVANPGVANGAQAIVVLGGGVSRAAPEYGGIDTINSRTLDRVRYAAWLHRQTGLPLLASGGRPYTAAPLGEAELMKSTLEKEFATPVRWVETDSANTFENARGSARILREAGITRVYLVTHSSHMRRAVEAFAPTGIVVIPAPINVFTRDPMTYRDFLPGPTGFQTSFSVAHEFLGRAWYAIRGLFEQNSHASKLRGGPTDLSALAGG